ncbi:MAG: hypothetical protein JSS29_01110 [Proteobacteria bacterium]|nr:hypothetical protein [Pseudomonadota bacterium]
MKVSLVTTAIAAPLLAVAAWAQTTQSSGVAGSYTTDPAATRPGKAGLAALVPPGITPSEACNGFNSVQLCAATLHAAQNLNLNFSDLKHKVAPGESLGAAIHTLRPQADAAAEERRAKAQALQDLQSPQG